MNKIGDQPGDDYALHVVMESISPGLRIRCEHFVTRYVFTVRRC